MMTTMLERAAVAVHNAEVVRGDLLDISDATAHNIARAVLMAVREPDDEFMLELYPDPEYDNRPMTRQGERSRRAGRMQIAHFIDTILSETP